MVSAVWGVWVVLGVAALLLISWELMVVFVAMLGGCCVDEGLVMSLLFPLCRPASYSSTCCLGENTIHGNGEVCVVFDDLYCREEHGPTPIPLPSVFLIRMQDQDVYHTYNDDYHIIRHNNKILKLRLKLELKLFL